MFRWGGVTYQRRLITSYCMWRFLVWELPNCSNKVPASRELGFLESQRINPDSMIFFPCMLSNSILRMINQNCFPLRERSGFVFAIQIECSAKSTDSWKDKFSVRISFSRSQWDLYCNCFLTFCMWVRRVTCLGRTSKGNQQTFKLFSVPHLAHHVHLMCLPILNQCIPLPQQESEPLTLLKWLLQGDRRGWLPPQADLVCEGCLPLCFCSCDLP